MANRFLNYQWKGKSKHGVHSPFVYDLITEVFENKTPYYCYEEIEKRRFLLEKSDKTIQVTDFGAGSHVNNNKTRKVSDIAKNAAKPKKFAQLLFRLVNRFQPQNIVELGTSLGLTSLYLANANTKSKLYTFEGCPETAQIARGIFQKYPCHNIEQIIGNFDQTYLEFLERSLTIDFAFFDGNHRKEPTLRYFYDSLPFKTESSVFIFDDIHWSDEMREAWEEIKKHPEVTVTIDLFFIGLVFFKKDQAKEDFVIKF